MENESLIKQLKTLKTIEPDPVFLKWSRRAIINTPAPLRQKPWYALDLSGLLYKGFTFSLSLGVAAIAIVVLSGITPTEQPTTASITSLNNRALLDEQEKVGVQDSTNEIKYYKGISPTVAMALNDITDPTTNWGGGRLIEESIKTLNEENN